MSEQLGDKRCKCGRWVMAWDIKCAYCGVPLAPPALPGTEEFETLLGPRGDLSTALAEALHHARNPHAHGHDVIEAIEGAFTALLAIRAFHRGQTGLRDQGET